MGSVYLMASPSAATASTIIDNKLKTLGNHTYDLAELCTTRWDEQERDLGASELPVETATMKQHT